MDSLNHEKERRKAIEAIHEAMDIVMVEISNVDSIERLYQIRDKFIHVVEPVPEVDECKEYKKQLGIIREVILKSKKC